MMKNFIAILFLITASIVNAQKCKPAISGVDEMTEETIEGWGGKIGGRSTIVTGTGYETNFYIGIDKGNTPFGSLNVKFIMPPEDAAIFNVDFSKGEKILLKTTGGLIEFEIEDVKKSQKRILSKFYVNFQLSGYLVIEDVKFLAEQSLEMYRAKTISGAKIEGKLGKKAKKKMKAQFSCFYSTLNK